MVKTRSGLDTSEPCTCIYCSICKKKLNGKAANEYYDDLLCLTCILNSKIKRGAKCNNCRKVFLYEDTKEYFEHRLCKECFDEQVERDEMFRAADDYYGRNDSVTPPRE